MKIGEKVRGMNSKVEKLNYLHKEPWVLINGQQFIGIKLRVFEFFGTDIFDFFIKI